VVFSDIISPTRNIEEIYFSEISFETQRTTRRHIPEDDTLQDSVRLLSAQLRKRRSANPHTILLHV
jgi:hypothetical protein